MVLTRADTVDEGVALDLVGAELQTFAMGRATVAVGTAAAAIIAEAVDDSSAGGVWNDRDLRLHGSVSVNPKAVPYVDS